MISFHGLIPCFHVISTSSLCSQVEVEGACGRRSSQTEESELTVAQSLDTGTELHLAVKYLFIHLSHC